jgi:hypothetical protein
MSEEGVKPIPAEQNFTARIQAVERYLSRIDGMLIDPSCHILINGFLGGYAYPEIGTSGYYSDKPIKNKYSDVHDGLQYLTTGLSAHDSEDQDLDDINLTDIEISQLPGNSGFIGDMV